jgi:hypothetical protein
VQSSVVDWVHSVYGMVFPKCIKIFPSQMIWVDLEKRSKHSLPRGLATPSRRLDRYKNHVQPRQGSRIVTPQDPPLMTIVLIKEPQTHWRLIGTSSPHLKRHILLQAGLLVEIKAI